MLSLLQLLPSPPARITGGRVAFKGIDLANLDAARMRKIRGARIGLVSQDPMTSLNPVLSVGYQIMEPLREHLGMSRARARSRAIELLELVGLPAAAKRIDDYPHQFSGGMRQRVVIAMALACDPEILIADEPTTALDVTVQAQILALVQELRRKLGMAVIWITHDLGVAASIADRVMVMYGGQVVELAGVGALFDAPRHPYTQGLFDSMPAHHGTKERLRTIEGTPAMLWQPPDRCTFAPRCPFVFDKCRRQNPPLMTVGDGHEAACWRAAEAGSAHAEL